MHTMLSELEPASCVQFVGSANITQQGGDWTHGAPSACVKCLSTPGGALGCCLVTI